MKDNTIHIILAGVNDADQKDLTTALRRNGHVARIVAVDKMDQLGKALDKGETDIVVLATHAPRLDDQKFLERLEGRDTALILLAETTETLLEPRIAAVLPPGDTERLAHCCVREFQARRTRLKLDEVQSQLQSAEERNAILLADADDAIAYVGDGMVIASNQRFADQLGFASCEELDCMPVIDLVSEVDQERLKNALKSQSQQDKTQLSVTAQCADGDLAPVRLQLQNTEYDSEPCVQLRIAQADTAGGSASTVERATGLTIADVFLDQLEDVLQHGIGGEGGAIALIAMDQYHELRSEHGISHVQALLTDFAALLRAELPNAQWGRVGDDLIAVLLRDCNAEQAHGRARELCKKAVKRIVEIGGQSHQYTVSIAVTGMEQRKLPGPTEMLDRLYSTCEEIAQRGGNDAAVHIRERQALNRDQATDDLIEDAMAEQRLQLLFHPMVNLGDGEGDHYEVLLDLKQHQGDEIDGMELLALSEGRGGDTALDRWILMEATKRLADARADNPSLRLLINVSGNILEDSSFLSWLAVAIKAAQLSGELLVLQLDQRILSSQLKQAQIFARKLRSLGCRFSVRGVVRDNHTSQLLKLIQPDIVKFHEGLEGNGRERLGELIEEVHHCNGKAIVPDVDSAASLATLWQLGPDFIQGSYVQDADTEMTYEFAELV